MKIKKSGNDSSGATNSLIHRAKDFGKSLETAGIEGAKLGSRFYINHVISRDCLSRDII